MINEEDYCYIPQHPVSSNDPGYMFPLFKFMQQKHANKMLSEGEIYIPNLYSFSNSNIHSGLTYDNKESKDRSDVLVYCTSGLLFSDSLSWAIEDKKETCVMITDSNKFRDLIEKEVNKSEYDILGFRSCVYVGENFRPWNNPRRRYFMKEKIFREQREVRLVMVPKEKIPVGSEIEPLKIKIPEVTEYLIEIKIDKVVPEILRGKKTGTITSKIHRKDGISGSEFTIEKPFGVYSPAILCHFEPEPSLGFSDRKNNSPYVGANITSGDSDARKPVLVASMDGFGVFVCPTPVNSIENIEIICENSER